MLGRFGWLDPTTLQPGLEHVGKGTWDFMLTSKTSILRRKLAKNITIISVVSEEMREVVTYVHISIKRPTANKWYLCSEASTHWGISSVVNPSLGSLCIQGLEMLYGATTIATPESKGFLDVSSFFICLCLPLWQKNVCMCNQCMWNSTTSNISLWKKEEESLCAASPKEKCLLSSHS